MLSGHAGLFLRSHLRAAKLQRHLAQVSVSFQFSLWIKQTTSTSRRLTSALAGARPASSAKRGGHARVRVGRAVRRQIGQPALDASGQILARRSDFYCFKSERIWRDKRADTCEAVVELDRLVMKPVFFQTTLVPLEMRDAVTLSIGLLSFPPKKPDAPNP